MDSCPARALQTEGDPPERMRPAMARCLVSPGRTMASGADIPRTSVWKEARRIRSSW